MARPKLDIDPEEVYTLASYSCNDQEIADWFGCHKDTIRIRFSQEVHKGRAAVKQKLRKAMYDNAVNNMSAPVQIFLAKNLLKMTDDPEALIQRDKLEQEERDKTETITKEFIEQAEKALMLAKQKLAEQK